MDSVENYSELVEQSRLGDVESLNSLIELVRGKLYTHIYRIMLDHEQTRDIVQETMLSMLECIDKLEQTEKFWPWLRGIATNKIRHYLRDKYYRRAVPISRLPSELSQEEKESQKEVANMMGQELQQIVFKAMGSLKLRYRQVLNLRCYENMPYSEIGKLMGCSELGARALFFRAKKSLRRQLSRDGFGKGFLLSALIIFGKLTAPNKTAAAEVSITSNTLRVGVTGALLGAAGSKTTIVSLTTAGILAIGGTVAAPQISKAITEAKKEATVFKKKVVEKVQAARVPAKTGEEYWYYYPEKTDGPVMTRVLKLDSKGKRSYCQYLQNEIANYHFDEQEGTVYINNYRMWRSDLAVMRLPADRLNLRKFLSRLEGTDQPQGFVPSNGQQLMLIVSSDGTTSGIPQIIPHANALKEEYFRYNWSGKIKLVDNRDAIHKRGWTYFRITGQINDKPITGAGRIPFVYEESKRHRGWLKMQIGDNLKIIDCSKTARIYDSRETKIKTYPAYSFFKGLSRPWMGLHTIDTIRRDAAELKIHFETHFTPGSTIAEVVLICGEVKLVYTIDMERDLIEKIIFAGIDGHGQSKTGTLNFTYLQDIEEISDQFAEPGVERPQTTSQPPEMLWLIKLILDKS